MPKTAWLLLGVVSASIQNCENLGLASVIAPLRAMAIEALVTTTAKISKTNWPKLRSNRHVWTLVLGISGAGDGLRKSATTLLNIMIALIRNTHVRVSNPQGVKLRTKPLTTSS